MYAIIATGGKQYKVKVEDVIDVELLGKESGDKVEFSEILACGEGEDIQVGSPLIEGITVDGVVVENFKDDKVIAFKMKKRKSYRRKKGHRQKLTKVKITTINTK